MDIPQDAGRRLTEEQLEADVVFLLDRANSAGRWNAYRLRDTGISANSLVSIAYGLEPLTIQQLPWDRSDLAACERAFEKLPEHRKTPDAREALERARAKIAERKVACVAAIWASAPGTENLRRVFEEVRDHATLVTERHLITIEEFTETEVVLEGGERVPIDKMLTAHGEETFHFNEAFAAVAGPTRAGKWLMLEVSEHQINGKPS